MTWPAWTWQRKKARQKFLGGKNIFFKSIKEQTRKGDYKQSEQRAKGGRRPSPASASTAPRSLNAPQITSNRKYHMLLNVLTIVNVTVSPAESTILFQWEQWASYWLKMGFLLYFFVKIENKKRRKQNLKLTTILPINKQIRCFLKSEVKRIPKTPHIISQRTINRWINKGICHLIHAQMWL